MEERKNLCVRMCIIQQAIEIMLTHPIKWGIMVLRKSYLLTVYPKKEKDNLTKAERDELRELVKVLGTQLKESEG